MQVENTHLQAVTGQAAGLACHTPSHTAFTGRRFFRKEVKFILSSCIALAFLYWAPPASASLITLSVNDLNFACGGPLSPCLPDPDGFNPLPDSVALANLMHDVSTGFSSSTGAAAAYINTTFIGNEPMAHVETSTRITGIENLGVIGTPGTKISSSEAEATISSVPYRLLALSQLPPSLSGIRVPVEFRVRTGWTLNATNEAPPGVRQPSAFGSAYGVYTVKSSLGELETDLFLSFLTIRDNQARFYLGYTLNIIDEGIETSESEEITDLADLGLSTDIITLLMQPHEQLELSMFARSKSLAECTTPYIDLGRNPPAPNCSSAESQMLLDPYIYVDPASPFAPYYAMQYNLDGQWLTTAPSFPAWSGEDPSVFPTSGWVSQPIPEPQPVPEPATLVIFAIGLAGLGFFGWRRNRFTAST